MWGFRASLYVWGGGGRTSVLCGGLGLVYTCGGRGEDECVVWGFRASLYVDECV